MQERAWLQLSIPASAMPAAAFARLASRLQAEATAEETDIVHGQVRRVAWFALRGDGRRLRARIAAACLLSHVPPEAIQLVELGDDWQSTWQQTWRAMPIGRRLWVRPSFREPAPEGRLDIVLDPGMAFGTGTHATTQLCLQAIEDVCEDALPTDMLDMGTGSGVLAIAAAKLGVGRVVAVDLDPACIDACRRNAARNRVNLEVRLDARPPAEAFELVVANILAGPLIDMAPALSACTGRHLILSGLLSVQVPDVRRAYEACGLTVTAEARRDEWAAIRMTPSTQPGSA